jgi:hypothetical protein
MVASPGRASTWPLADFMLVSYPSASYSISGPLLALYLIAEGQFGQLQRRHGKLLNGHAAVNGVPWQR